MKKNMSKVKDALFTVISKGKEKVSKSVLNGKEGKISSYAFKIYKFKFLVSVSETKWHKGEKFKDTPIFFSKIGGKIPAIFIQKVAIGCIKDT